MPTPFSRTTRSLDQATAGPAVAAWLLAAALLAAWTLWFFAGRVTVHETSTRARVEVQQAAHPLAALLSGRVRTTRLALGQTVAAGEVLVELDASGATLRLNEEQARWLSLGVQLNALGREIVARAQAQAPERLAALAAQQGAQARTQEAAAALAHAVEQEARLRAEAANGSVAAVEALQARAEMQKLAAAREALAAEARRLQASGESHAAEQRAQIDALLRTQAALAGERAASAQALERLRLEVEQHRLRAPVAGTVGDVVPLRPGEVVGAGQRFASVIPAGDFIVVADFEPQAALGRLRPGQTAQLRLDAYPWAQFGMLQATVSHVAGELRDGRVRVELQPLRPWPPGVQLQHGLPGTVAVAIAELSPAVLVLRASGQMLAAGGSATAAKAAAP